MKIGESAVLEGNSLKSNNIPFTPQTQVLGVILATRNDENTLLDCLIEKESGGNPNAYNPKDTDGKPRYGLLQYDIPTWNEWCVVKYGLPDDIWNGEIQKECANRMIFEDGQIWRWPPAKECQ